MNQHILKKIVTLAAKDPDRCQWRTKDDTVVTKFHELFPLESLPKLTLEQYCLGHSCRPDNFSWWLERGMQKAIGTYSPGTSKGHLIYLQRGGGYYMHRGIADLGPQGALDVVRETLYAIASCSTLEEARVIDDQDALAKRAGIERSRLVGGQARQLRILSMYHPDWMFPMNSVDHLKHFLTMLSVEEEPQLPRKSIELVIELSKRLAEVRQATGLNVTPWGFCNLLYDAELGILPQKRESIYKGDTSGEAPPDKETVAPPPRNLILYGPPGTGKTYSTIDRALEIIDPAFLGSVSGDKDARSKMKARFDELSQAKRIGFVTFHQSFSYEDFVEGLKATTDQDGKICYEIQDGIFKQMCSTAAAQSEAGKAGPVKKLDPSGRQIWKLSLGNTNGPDAAIYDECIENGYALLGWGHDIDFTGASTRDHIKEKIGAGKPVGSGSDYAVTACHAFVNTMKPGDLIIVSDGNYKFRAIGEVKGDYRFLPVAEDRELLYQQCRDVDWIRTFSPSLANDQLMTVAFSQMSLYRLNPPAIDIELLAALLNGDAATGEDGCRPIVLIIDEINRGNISRVFGELITLIEDSKRTGRPEALAVKLPYSKETFSVPANLYLIGTMNTADRSLAQVDIALRRRFVFEELMPNPSVLAKLPIIDGIQVDKLLKVMNSRIEVLYDREHTIGHTFFLSLREDPSLAEMERIFSGSILPLLEEYFFEDWEKIRIVLGDHQKPIDLAMIRPKYSEKELESLFGAAPDHPVRVAYERNDNALSITESYIGIYDSSINTGNGSAASAP